MVAVVMRYGTEELPATTSEHCSRGDEPVVASYERAQRRVPDLANAKNRAVRDGDSWVITGRKVWTSLAH